MKNERGKEIEHVNSTYKHKQPNSLKRFNCQPRGSRKPIKRISSISSPPGEWMRERDLYLFIDKSSQLINRIFLFIYRLISLPLTLFHLKLSLAGEKNGVE